MIFGFALTAFLVGTVIFSAVESQIYDKLFGSVSVKTDDEKSEILKVNYSKDLTEDHNLDVNHTMNLSSNTISNISEN